MVPEEMKDAQSVWKQLQTDTTAKTGPSFAVDLHKHYFFWLLQSNKGLISKKRKKKTSFFHNEFRCSLTDESFKKPEVGLWVVLQQC